MFFKWANPGLFYCLFSVIQTNIITIFTRNICEKCQSSIQCWDSIPQPSEHESPPITTIAGLLPMMIKMFALNQVTFWR